MTRRIAPGGVYVADGTAWRAGALTPLPLHVVDNPGPGQTTTAWDEGARTFGVKPLYPLPVMPVFYADGAAFTGPNAIRAVDIQSAGDGLRQIVDKAAALATDPAKIYTLVLEAKTYTLSGFTHGAARLSGVQIPPNLAIWGAGSGPTGTVIRLLQDTSEYNLATCTWPGDYGTPKCGVLRVEQAKPGWAIRHVRVECSRQGTDNNGKGHPYNGIQILQGTGRQVVENVHVRGHRGYLHHPPGEAGGITAWQAAEVIMRNIEIDGRELGSTSDAVAARVSSAGIMIDETRAVLIDVYVHHLFTGGGGVAIWWSGGVTTFNVSGHHLGGGVDPTEGVMGCAGINHERADLITHYSPRFVMDRVGPNALGAASLQFAMANDMGWQWQDGTATLVPGGVPGRMLLVDPMHDPTSDVLGRVSTQSPATYNPMGEDPAVHYQRNSVTSGPTWLLDRDGAVMNAAGSTPDGDWVRYTSPMPTPEGGLS